jgi:hypothetical protein
MEAKPVKKSATKIPAKPAKAEYRPQYKNKRISMIAEKSYQLLLSMSAFGATEELQAKAVALALFVAGDYEGYGWKATHKVHYGISSVIHHTDEIMVVDGMGYTRVSYLLTPKPRFQLIDGEWVYLKAGAPAPTVGSGMMVFEVTPL